MKRIILIAAIAVAACNRQESTRAMQPLFVEVSSPIVRQVTLTREYPGYLQADATVSITGRVNGTLTDRSYTPGERVKKGKLIAREKVRNCIMCYPFYSVINKYYKINGELVKWRSDLFKK